MKDLKKIKGKVFFSQFTNKEYGVIRECDNNSPEFFSEEFGHPVAEDSCGNLFIENERKEICFWDHETDEIEMIANNWQEFVDSCVEPEEIKMKEEDIVSVWIDPDFAKKEGMNIPYDGWVKKGK